MHIKTNSSIKQTILYFLHIFKEKNGLNKKVYVFYWQMKTTNRLLNNIVAKLKCFYLKIANISTLCCDILCLHWWGMRNITDAKIDKTIREAICTSSQNLTFIEAEVFEFSMDTQIIIFILYIDTYNKCFGTVLLFYFKSIIIVLLALDKWSDKISK